MSPLSDQLPEQISFLEIAPENWINVGGQLIKKPTIFKLKNTKGQGRQFSYRYVHNEKRYLVTARVFLVGKRQYQTTFLMLESLYNEALGQKYLNSFKLVEPANDKPPAPRKKN